MNNVINTTINIINTIVNRESITVTIHKEVYDKLGRHTEDVPIHILNMSEQFNQSLTSISDICYDILKGKTFNCYYTTSLNNSKQQIV